MCGEDSSKNYLIAINSANRGSGTYNDFRIVMPFNTVVRKVALVGLQMTLPAAGNGCVGIKIRELPTPCKIASSSSESFTTFLVLCSGSNLQWSESSEFSQEVVCNESSLGELNITVVDNSGAKIAINTDWSMVLRVEGV